MGLGNDPFEEAKQQFVQRQLQQAAAAKAAPAPSLDALSPEAVVAKQRAAMQMRDGLNSDLGTSTRGTDLPQGVGVKGPPSATDNLPIIGTAGDRYAGPSVDQQAAAAAARQKAQDDADLIAARGTQRR